VPLTGRSTYWIRGNLLTKTKKQIRSSSSGSVAVSRDGKKIVVADLITLYGFDLIGEPR